MTALAELRPEQCVRAVGVVVPARNEQERIGPCLTSVRRALDALPDDIAVAVAVVLDRCTDATPERVAALLDDWPQAVALPVDARPAPTDGAAAGVSVLRRPRGTGVGALRDHGVRTVLNRLGAHPADGIWLLSTDADTTVPHDWALAHVGYAEHLAADALARYRARVDRGIRGATHDHIYGANLGVRADAYLAVAGFPPDGVGEDHGLWQRLDAAGYTLERPTALRVRTSARLHGRATDGLAGLLRSLHHVPAPAE